MSQNAMTPLAGATAVAKLQLAHNRSGAALRARLALPGKGTAERLIAQTGEVEQRFAAEATAAGSRTVIAFLAERRAELYQLIDNGEQSEPLSWTHATPVISRVVLDFE